jgi:hypothetical protein
VLNATPLTVKTGHWVLTATGIHWAGFLELRHLSSVNVGISGGW